MKITRREEHEKLYSIDNGSIFTATFIKKDGSLRRMNCRRGVRKYLKGGVLKYNPKDRNLISVFDMKAQGYRMINIDTLQSLRMEREDYTVEA